MTEKNRTKWFVLRLLVGGDVLYVIKEDRQINQEKNGVRPTNSEKQKVLNL